MEFVAGASVPVTLFDSALDNLLQNALRKRQSDADLRVRVVLAADAARLGVCDTGGAVPAAIVDGLLQAPVPSEDGLGIGLYHAARQAEGYGFSLALASNVQGAVCFELARADSSRLRGA